MKKDRKETNRNNGSNFKNTSTLDTTFGFSSSSRCFILGTIKIIVRERMIPIMYMKFKLKACAYQVMITGPVANPSIPANEKKARWYPFP